MKKIKAYIRRCSLKVNDSACLKNKGGGVIEENI